MALGATIHHIGVAISDVDRDVYTNVDLRVAQHPSETMRFLLTRLLAYCLSYEEGISFSKGGVSSADEPPVAVRDPTGLLIAWIDVGTPSAERLHKASKAARCVSIYTSADLAQLQREARTRPIHRVEDIEVWRIEPDFLGALEASMTRTAKLELTRSEGLLYVAVADKTLETALTRASLACRVSTSVPSAAPQVR